jgi:flagellar basal body-associated protein FliL
MSDTQLLERQEKTVEPVAAPPRRRSGIIPIAIVLGVVAFFVVIGIWIVSSLRDLADAVPTPSDIAAMFEPEPYEEIGPVVISSIRDLSNLTTVESVQYNRRQGHRSGLARLGPR